MEHKEIMPLTQGHMAFKCQHLDVFYYRKSDVFFNENFYICYLYVLFHFY